jgi:tRNA dimethylallyltransferase
MVQRRIVVLYGPTGVGKTDFSLELADKVRGEIINADVGQFYKPLSIGTAKPAWHQSSIAHHLFDILDEPIDLTVMQFREKVSVLLEEIWQRGNLPIVVGGSGFYVSSLFFSPQQQSKIKTVHEFENQDTKNLWLLLQKIDPERAQKIHYHDRYRILRALEIWATTGEKPSKRAPCYKPLASFFLLCITRDREDLYARINKRVNLMMDEGWIAEVRRLQCTAWESFLKEKKIIGYDDIFSFLQGPQTAIFYENLVSTIAQKCRNYAKRQMTFWRMLRKKLEYHNQDSSSLVEEINLTNITAQVYIKQILNNKEFFR